MTSKDIKSNRLKDYVSLAGSDSQQVDVYTSRGKYVGDGQLALPSNGKATIKLREKIFGKSDTGGSKIMHINLSGRTYTLLDCKKLWDSITPRAIVFSDKKTSKFSGFSFYIPGLTRWLAKDRLTLDDSSEINKFNVPIKDCKGRNWTILIEEWSGKSRVGDNSTLSESFAIVTIYATQKVFDVDDLYSKCREIRTLFTLLIGHPVAISHIWEVAGTYPASIYTYGSEDKDIAFDSQINCIVDANYISDNDLWEKILATFFQEPNDSDSFNLWGRIAGVMGYIGFWEYEILAYVSFLDKYSSIRAGRVGAKCLSDRSHRKLKSFLKKNIKDYFVDSNDNEVIESYCDQVDFLQNSRLSTFAKKLSSTLCEELLSVIDFREEHFSHLKRLRDKIAHGSEPGTFVDNDITSEYILMNKVYVILMCWFYQDVGISNEVIFKFFSWCHHSRVFGARLQWGNLHENIGSHDFIESTNKCFSKVNNTKFKDNILVLEYKNRSRKLSMSDKVSKSLSIWDMDGKKYKCVQYYVADNLLSDQVESITYSNSLYLCNKGKKVKPNTTICILNLPEECQSEQYTIKKGLDGKWG